MKKVLITALLLHIFLTSSVFAASVVPEDYNGISTCYEMPGCNLPGTYTAIFNDGGEVDPNGSNFFSVTVGTMIGRDYTQVLSWQSNFPIYAVIVSDGESFNIYEYSGGERDDTDLIPPKNMSGSPSNLRYVSIVLSKGLLMQKISPESNSQPLPTICPSMSPSPVVQHSPGYPVGGAVLFLIILAGFDLLAEICCFFCISVYIRNNK